MDGSKRVIDDSYELIQRQALFLMGKSGNPDSNTKIHLV
jgi:hypothetical protein